MKNEHIINAWVDQSQNQQCLITVAFLSFYQLRKWKEPDIIFTNILRIKIHTWYNIEFD